MTSPAFADQHPAPSFDALHLGAVVPTSGGFLLLLDRDGVVLDVRAGAQAQRYLAATDIVGHRITLRLPRDVATAVQGAIDRSAAGEVTPVTFVLPIPDGTRSFDAVLIPLAGGRTLAAVTETSRAARAEEALRASEERTRALLEVGLDVVLTLDDAAVITFASPAVERVLGYAPDALLGKTLPSLVHPDDNTVLLPRFAALRTGQRPEMRGSARVRHRDGHWCIIEGMIRDLRANPAVRGIVFNGRDVSEQRALQERLFQSDKLDSIGRLAGGIAHDFNNVLTAILGTTEMLQSELRRGRAPTVEDFDEIKRAGKRARDLTTQLLAFARRQVIAPRLIDPNEVVRGMEAMTRRLVGENVEIAMTLAPEPWLIHADPSQLEQVVLNLAVNARDAMREGGTLYLETANVELDDAYAASHRDVVAGPHLRLSVRDTGSGIPPETLQHIFEPFYTTKSSGEGSGLGLATVYGVVRQSRGHVTVTSAVGQGTAFDVYFPKAGEGRPSAVDAESQPTMESAGHETILLVEDDELVRALSVRGLKEAGYDVLVASDPDEATAIATSFDAPIDLLVSDVVMPKRNGTVLARELLLARPSMKVLFVSGYTDESIMQQGVTDPGVHFLPKPFTPSELCTRVRKILDG